MEVLSFFLLFFAYIGLRLLFTDYRDATEKDRKTYAQGVELMKKRQFEEARTYFDEVLAENPQSASGLCHKRQVCLAKRRYAAGSGRL